MTIYGIGDEMHGGFKNKVIYIPHYGNWCEQVYLYIHDLELAESCLQQ